MAYFPNASDPRANTFENDCARCIFGEEPCPIAGAQVLWNYDQIGNDLAREMLNSFVDEETGHCRLFQLAGNRLVRLEGSR